MKIIANVNRKTVYIVLGILTILVLGVAYSHIFLDTIRHGLYYRVFGEATPYVIYILFILGSYYFASMLWSDQGYLSSDGNYLFEFKGSKIKLSEIVAVNLTRKSFGIKNITIDGKSETINIRSHFIGEDTKDVINIIKHEAKLELQ